MKKIATKVDISGYRLWSIKVELREYIAYTSTGIEREGVTLSLGLGFREVNLRLFRQRQQYQRNWRLKVQRV